MSDVAEIKAELSGNTYFDEEHENELFKRIAEIEDQENKGELVKELTKTDYIIIALLFIVFGIVPVIWYAVI